MTTKPIYIYHRCPISHIGWFKAHGWKVVGYYADRSVSMASLRHVDIEDEETEE